jgi:3-deoxy-D-manno-octulosonate 8-phosphate phosphatase (KDO 8-P phosphatase)
MNQITCLVLDVDGVLTDSRIYITDKGEEIKAFNSKDGHGLKLILRAGIEVVIITGRISGALEHRARELGMQWIWLKTGQRLSPEIPAAMERCGRLSRSS